MPWFCADFNCFGVLREYHPGPIFPHLQYLKIYTDMAAPYAAMFIQPILLSLVFWPIEIEYLLSVLGCVEGNAPNLRDLYLMVDYYFTLDDVETELNRTIRCLKHLLRVDFACIPFFSNTLVHLSSLPDFDSLLICLIDENCQAWTSPDWGMFPFLRKLRIWHDMDDGNALASFLDSISAPYLVNLVVEFETSPPTNRLFAAIGKFKHLQDLMLDFKNRENMWEDNVFDGRILCPLFSIAAMRSFSLIFLPIKFSRDDLRKMASSWLFIRDIGLHTLHVGIALEDLMAFARCCIYLESLSVEIEPIEQSWTWRPERISDVPLCLLPELWLGHAVFPAATAVQVASFLARVFPLAVIKSFHLPSDAQTDATNPQRSWKE